MFRGYDTRSPTLLIAVDSQLVAHISESPGYVAPSALDVVNQSPSAKCFVMPPPDPKAPDFRTKLVNTPLRQSTVPAYPPNIVAWMETPKPQSTPKIGATCSTSPILKTMRIIKKSSPCSNATRRCGPATEVKSNASPIASIFALVPTFGANPRHGGYRDKTKNRCTRVRVCFPGSVSERGEDPLS